jgi:hypothetical protein
MLGHRPTADEYGARGKYSRSLLFKNGGVRRISNSLGLSFQVKTNFKKTVTKDLIIKELRDLQKEIGRIPTSTEYVNTKNRHIKTALRVMGVKHWYEVILQAFDLSEVEAAMRIPATKRTVGDWAILIQDLCGKLKRIPTANECAKHIGLRFYGCPSLSGYTISTLLAKCGFGATSKRRTRKQFIKPLSPVPDAMRDTLKESSVEAIQSFFKQRG